VSQGVLAMDAYAFGEEEAIRTIAAALSDAAGADGHPRGRTRTR